MTTAYSANTQIWPNSNRIQVIPSALQSLYDANKSKAPIIWRISARLTGLKFQSGFWNKSSENQIVDYMEGDSAQPNGPENLKKSYVIETEFQPGLKKEREHAD